MKHPRITVLGKDPGQGHRINVNSFQQDALLSFAGFQYAAWYEDSDHGSSTRWIYLGRRKLPEGQWQKFLFQDYEQTRDDGHNTISLGISGDGVIHLAYDLHNMDLNYRRSNTAVALEPELVQWKPDLFTSNLNTLSSRWPKSMFERMTYPRFLRLDCGDLLFEFRLGRSGLGDDHLWRYHAEQAEWSPVGPNSGLYLKGIENNAYINGIDSSQGRLYVSWTYRKFVEDGGPSEVSSQAGPNGPENNYDLMFAYSDDEGVSWKDANDNPLAMPILPSTPGIVAFHIPPDSGILNQEGQTVDRDGTFHVINRETTDGTGRWYHYWLKNKFWHRAAIRHPTLDTPQLVGNRAKLLVDRDNNLYALLPGNTNTIFTILRASIEDGYASWSVVFHKPCFDGEPLFDRSRLSNENVASIIQRTSTIPRSVVVLDLSL